MNVLNIIVAILSFITAIISLLSLLIEKGFINRKNLKNKINKPFINGKISVTISKSLYVVLAILLIILTSFFLKHYNKMKELQNNTLRIINGNYYGKYFENFVLLKIDSIYKNSESEYNLEYKLEQPINEKGIAVIKLRSKFDIFHNNIGTVSFEKSELLIKKGLIINQINDNIKIKFSETSFLNKYN